MRLPSTRRPGAVLVLVGAFTLAVVLPPCVGGNLPSEVNQESAQLQPAGSVQQATDTDTSNVPECGVDGNGRSNLETLKLVGRNGLQFKCGASETLGPPADVSKNFTLVYGDKEGGGCNTEVGAKTLDSLVPGATLTLSTEDNSLEKKKEPVYTLAYSAGPERQQSLCYTCNAPSDELPVFRGSESAVACTVVITVPARTPPSTDTSPTPPSSGSSAGALAPGVIAVAGVFVSVVLLS